MTPVRPCRLCGADSQLEPVAGTWFENWDTVELSQRGIEGMERMRLVCDDIDHRILGHFTGLTCSAGGAYLNTC